VFEADSAQKRRKSLKALPEHLLQRLRQTVKYHLLVLWQ
jgi:hypothetical protein